MIFWTFRNKNYKNRKLRFDYFGYKNCIFEDCTLLYSGGSVKQYNCFYERPTFVGVGKFADGVKTLKMILEVSLKNQNISPESKTYYERILSALNSIITIKT